MRRIDASTRSLLACRVDRRRALLRAKDFNGIDDIEVGAPDPLTGSITLCVHFLGAVPEDVTVANILIEGGCDAPRLKVLRVEPRPAQYEDDDDCLEIALDRVGDASVYTLCLVEPDEYGRPSHTPLAGFEGRYCCRSFTFTQACSNDLDCLPDKACLPAPTQDVAWNYLAKDYATFRRLMLDRMALLVPEWRERHVPDVGIMLVELLAYVADQLSYYQDVVATEAYLNTARQRISVRRHGRLVDYVLHEGCNARAFVVVEVEQKLERPADKVRFLTAYPGALPSGRPLVIGELGQADHAGYRCFMPFDQRDDIVRLLPDRHRIRIHTWGDRECCLQLGATSATLVATSQLDLRAGDFLLFEEVVGPDTGQPGDADPTHRHVVRLTKVEEGHDEILDLRLLEVCWAAEDALPFPLCLSSIGPAPDCKLLVDVSVARGNVVLVDEGCCVCEDLSQVPTQPPRLVCEGECEPADDEPRPGRFTLPLEHPDVTYAEPAPVSSDGCLPSAASFLVRDPHKALPAVTLSSGWKPCVDLLDSGPDDRHFVVEVDDDRVASLRFGDGRTGEEPVPGTAFRACYRFGSGPAGNVGAETIVLIALDDALDSRILVRNPLPATGGTAPEDTRDAKLAIPVAFRAARERAITGDDYAEIAQAAGGTSLQRASGRLVWTGSWYRAEVALDPLAAGVRSGCGCGCGCGDVAPRDCGCGRKGAGAPAAIVDALERARRMGHDLDVGLAVAVPVDVQLAVCVLPHYVRAQVKAALLVTFSSGVLSDGRPAYFNPDLWTFGDSLDVSRLLAVAQTVEGVESAEVTRLIRQGDVDRGELKAGVLKVGPQEVITLSSDPTRARSGRLDVVAKGGR
jgi:hypothetical protein